MPNTYTQILIQLVFAVKYRQRLISEKMREPLEKYITGIVSNNGHKLLSIYCMPDHCHILTGLNPKQSISDLTREIKSNSSKWINEQFNLPGQFRWQEGFGAFSYANSQLYRVANYIKNQPEHHKKSNFRNEFIGILKRRDVTYDEKYLFDWFDQG